MINLASLRSFASAERVWGLRERLAAARSLLTLAHEFRIVKRPLLSLLTASQVAAAETFYSRTVEVSRELCHHVTLEEFTTETVDSVPRNSPVPTICKPWT